MAEKLVSLTGAMDIFDLAAMSLEDVKAIDDAVYIAGFNGRRGNGYQGNGIPDAQRVFDAGEYAAGLMADIEERRQSLSLSV